MATNSTSEEHMMNKWITDKTRPKAAFPHWRVRESGEGQWYGKPRKWLQLGDDYQYLAFNDNGLYLEKTMNVLAFAASNNKQSINRLLATYAAYLIEDAIIVSFAEHNGTYTAAYKNLFDWTSRINKQVFQHKPVVFLSTSPGPGGAASVLATAVNSAPNFAADMKASISVPSFHENFDIETNKIVNLEIQHELQQAMQLLAASGGSDKLTSVSR